MTRHRIHDAAFSDLPDGAATAALSPSTAPVAGDRFLRAREVCARVGLSRTSIWRAVRRGEFPSPRRLSVNAIAWLASEVEAWMASRAPTRAEGAP
jgi:prophage regulatory protein